MRLTCPECQNSVNTSTYINIAIGNVIECDVCGITLMVNKIEGDAVTAEVVDEGK
jgi:transcription elongation factor Elf1